MVLSIPSVGTLRRNWAGGTGRGEGDEGEVSGEERDDGCKFWLVYLFLLRLKTKSPRLLVSVYQVSTITLHLELELEGGAREVRKVTGFG